MQKILLTMLSVVYFAGELLAADTHVKSADEAGEHVITTSSGDSYERFKVLRTEPDGVVIMHSRGITKLPFSELPKELREEHEVDLPGFIKPQDAARYWPNNIQDVIDTLAPEIAAARADHDNAVQALNNAERALRSFNEEITALPERDMTYWYSKIGPNYAYIDGNLYTAKNDLSRISGKVLSIVDDSNVLIMGYNREVMACRVKSTHDLVDDQHFDRLAIPIGTYRYTSTIGAAKQVKYYEAVPRITIDAFIELGEDAFPEIEEARRSENEIHQQRIESTRRRLENNQQRLVKAEQDAQRRLQNAGSATYERLLEEKVREETTRAQAQAIAAAREEQYRQAKKRQEDEAKRRKEYELAEQRRRAAEAQKERYRMKGPDDFR